MTDKNEAIQKAIIEEQRLIKRVFSTEDGQKLLTALAQQYVWSKQLTNDTHELFGRIACQELVTHFINCTNFEEVSND